jgi:hypothetical protein
MHKWLFQDLGSVSPKAKAGATPGRSITVFDYFSTAFTAIVTFIPRLPTMASLRQLSRRFS